MALPTVSESERHQEQTAPVQPGQLRGRTAMSKEAMKQALEALEWEEAQTAYPSRIMTNAITALREALAEQPAQQEPVATVTSETGADISMSWWHEPALPVGTTLYTTPAQRKPWVGLTDEEITDIWAESSPYYHEDDFARAIEAKLKEKNT